MINGDVLDNSSGWLIFSVSLVLMFGGNYLGYRLGLWHTKKIPDAHATANTEILGAIFVVLGLILAFLFGMSLNRMEHKKEMVLTEASAILSAYQSSQFLPEPHKTNSGKLIKEYADLRFQLAVNARKDRNIEALKEGIIRSERIQDSLLQEGLAVQLIPEADASTFTESISGLIDINMRRINNSIGDRIPVALKVLMYIMTLLSLAAMGYGSGLKGGHSLIPNIILVAVFAIIIWIIIDMDHPANLLFKVNQQPMLDVIHRINTMQL
jgi:hypothetical protein